MDVVGVNDDWRNPNLLGLAAVLVLAVVFLALLARDLLSRAGLL